MSSRWLAFVLTMVLCSVCLAEGVAPIVVGDGGVLLKDGKPWRGIGINYFSAFGRALEDPADTSYREGFQELGRRGIPFVRVAMCPFWPKDWRLYLDDKESYFRLMDGVVKSAEESRVGLIASLFWWFAGVPDVVGEPCSALGNPDSRTLAFMRQYVKDVVLRYGDSPAIWAWELGNEYSLQADLPKGGNHRAWVLPHVGTPESRSEADDLTHDMIVTVTGEFAKAVREHDKLRPISTGHSLPRPSAQHLRTEGTWGQDTPEQLQQNVIDVTPDPANMISVHVYPIDSARFGRTDVEYGEVLRICMEAGKRAGKTVFLGEFGAPESEEAGGREKARAESLSQIRAIIREGVPISALWNYDLPSQEKSLNVTPTNHRSYLLDELARANAELAGASQAP